MYFSGLFVRRQTISFSHTLLCLRKGNFALELKNRLKMSNLGWMKIENWIKEIFFDLFFYKCQNYFAHCHPWDKWFFKTKVILSFSSLMKLLKVTQSQKGIFMFVWSFLSRGMIKYKIFFRLCIVAFRIQQNNLCLFFLLSAFLFTNVDCWIK